MLTRDEQDLAKSRPRQMPAFRDDLIDAEGHAQDGIVPGKATVTAIVDAFVREIQRRKKTHGAPEILQGQRARRLRQTFQVRIGPGRNQILEAMEEARFLQRQIIEKLGKGHREQFRSQVPFRNPTVFRFLSLLISRSGEETEVAEEEGT